MDSVPEKDFDSRKTEFLEKYKTLIDEMKVDILSVPTYTPTQNGTWELRIVSQIVDTTDQSVPSPFIA